MTGPRPTPTQAPETPRERLEQRLRQHVKGPGAKKLITLTLIDVDAYAAQLAEEIARPDDRWGPQ